MEEELDIPRTEEGNKPKKTSHRNVVDVSMTEGIKWKEQRRTKERTKIKEKEKDSKIKCKKLKWKKLQGSKYKREKGNKQH